MSQTQWIRTCMVAFMVFFSAGFFLGKKVGKVENNSTPISYNLNQNDGSLPHIPGGFQLRGMCNFQAIREQNATVDLAMFVKHGIHTSDHMPKSCHDSISNGSKQEKVQMRRYSNMIDGSTSKAAANFIRSGNEHKILPVRPQTSFYKSAFNHLCNNDRKERWRQKNHINCTNEGEFIKMLSLDSDHAQEIGFAVSPFLWKEIIMQSHKVRSLMLIDYTCLPRVVNSICDEPMETYEHMSGRKSNSAEGQNYTDYWTMQNNRPFVPFNPFWDVIYERLKDTCCLEFVRPN
eukprot:272016_1